MPCRRAGGRWPSSARSAVVAFSLAYLRVPPHHRGAARYRALATARAFHAVGELAGSETACRSLSSRHPAVRGPHRGAQPAPSIAAGGVYAGIGLAVALAYARDLLYGTRDL